jgi:hypothetical protein
MDQDIGSGINDWLKEKIEGVDYPKSVNSETYTLRLWLINELGSASRVELRDYNVGYYFAVYRSFHFLGEETFPLEIQAQGESLIERLRAYRSADGSRLL